MHNKVLTGILLALVLAAGQATWAAETENPGTKAEKGSAAARIHFDQIGEVRGLKMKFTPRKEVKVDKDGRHHFTVSVSVPLASLGLQNPAGKRFGFDMSVAIANEAGDCRERAGHWAGMSEAVVVDRPGSMVLLPDNWGTLSFAPPEE